MKSFLKFFWDDPGNKGFVAFVLAFIIVFHIVGGYVTGTTWSDIWPMYCIIGAITLTIFIYTYRRWKVLRDEDAEDKIKNTHL